MLAFRYEFPVESKVIVLFRVPLLGETERERDTERKNEEWAGKGWARRKRSNERDGK